MGVNIKNKKPVKILTNSNAKPGDALILTKALGTGIVTTALKLGSISSEQYEEVTASMLMLNKTPSKLAVEFGAHACTDITGFSLLGHAWGMADASDVGMVFYSSNVPVLSGVEELVAKGYLTKGDITNRDYLAGNIQIDDKISEDFIRVLYDPQTSGGLLIAISSEVADEFVNELRKQGVSRAEIIGRVTKENSGKIVVINE